MTVRMSDATRQAIAAAWSGILSEIEGGALIVDACAEYGLPANLVREYRREDAERSRQWNDARKDSAAQLEEEAVETVRNRSVDAAYARVLVDTLKWAAAKRNPDHYAERTRQDINVKTLDYSAILARAEARLAQQRAPALIDGRTGALLPDIASDALDAVLSDAAKSLF